MKKDFLITTAIDYANGSPHVGHAYEKILTDIIARHKRLLGYNVKFVTGLDEHGQKVQMNAKSQGVKPIEICDNYAKEFNELCRELYITNDDYIRTTESRHKNVVRKVLEKLYDRGE